MSKDMLDPDAEMDQFMASDDDEGMVLDLNKVDENAPLFDPMPPGTYDCIVENTEYGPSKAGNPMITWVFKVIDPEYEGRLLFFHTTLNHDKGVQRLKQILVRIVPDLDLGSFNPKKFCEEGLAIGYPCRAKVRIRPYEGQRRNDVTDILAPAEEGSFLDG